MVATTASGPWELAARDPDPIHDAIADRVLEFVRPGARLQCGPGQLGLALLRRVRSPLQIDTGLLTDAVPSRFGGRSTFVEKLSRPASTPGYDVEVIVTEHGAVDLRSADWEQRRRLITRHFEAAA